MDNNIEKRTNVACETCSHIKQDILFCLSETCIKLQRALGITGELVFICYLFDFGLPKAVYLNTLMNAIAVEVSCKITLLRRFDLRKERKIKNIGTETERILYTFL